MKEINRKYCFKWHTSSSTSLPEPLPVSNLPENEGTPELANKEFFMPKLSHFPNLWECEILRDDGVSLEVPEKKEKIRGI